TCLSSSLLVLSTTTTSAPPSASMLWPAGWYMERHNTTLPFATSSPPNHDPRSIHHGEPIKVSYQGESALPSAVGGCCCRSRLPWDGGRGPCHPQARLRTEPDRAASSHALGRNQTRQVAQAPRLRRRVAAMPYAEPRRSQRPSPGEPMRRYAAVPVRPRGT